MRDFGYDVANYTDVDPVFGNLTDFDQLISEAHKKGEVISTFGSFNIYGYIYSSTYHVLKKERKMKTRTSATQVYCSRSLPDNDGLVGQGCYAFNKLTRFGPETLYRDGR